MDKETITTYGFILLAVMLMGLLITMSTPIGNKLFGDVENKIETMVYNTGVIDANAKGDKYGTIIVHHRYHGYAEDFDTTQSSGRIGETFFITYPEIDGYEAKTETGGEITQKLQFTEGITEIEVYYFPKTYNITYMVNGGNIKESMIVEYQYGSRVILPTNIEKDGYHFAGWYNDSGLGGDRIYSINKTEFGDKVFYAKYSII